MKPVPKLHVAPKACSTCPYRRDTEPGIWSAAEYEKLRDYDVDPSELDPADVEALASILSLFHCHQQSASGVETICRGWLGVHRYAVVIRLACLTGALAWDDVPLEAEPYLYASGAEAADAGLAGVKEPSRKARSEIQKLIRREIGRYEDERGDK